MQRYEIAGEKLRSMLKNRSKEFEHYYHYVIRELRKNYSRMCGYADIPEDKVIRIYTDSAYCEAFSKTKIADQEFVNLYIGNITNSSC